MRNENDAEPASAEQEQPADNLASRRAMLRIGALGAAAVVTIRPGIAQAATSVMTCSVPVPDSDNAGKWIAADGSVVKKNTNGAFAGPTSALPGEQVKNSLKYGTNYTGYSSQQTSAYNNYIKKLTMGKQGYTCYASLQSPARQ